MEKAKAENYFTIKISLRKIPYSQYNKIIVKVITKRCIVKQKYSKSSLKVEILSLFFLGDLTRNFPTLVNIHKKVSKYRPKFKKTRTKL